MCGLPFGKECFSRVQDFVAEQPIPAAFQRAFAHEVHISVPEGLQLLLHLDMVEQAPIGFSGESDQDIHIAVRGEVGAQDGAEQSQFADSPTSAELVDFSCRRNRNKGVHGRISQMTKTSNSEFNWHIVDEGIGRWLIVYLQSAHESKLAKPPVLRRGPFPVHQLPCAERA